MGQQRVQPVQADAFPPAVGERVRLVVRPEHALQVGQSEEAEHGEVGLPVTAVRGRVDQVYAVGGPQHVAGPQVAVDPARYVGRVVVRPGLEAGADALDHFQLLPIERALVVGGPQVRADAEVGVEPTPRPRGLPRVRQHERAYVPVTVPAVRRYAEVSSAGVVRRGQPPTELVGRRTSRCGTLQPGRAQVGGRDVERLRHGDPARDGEPPQTRRLHLEKPHRRIPPPLHMLVTEHGYRPMTRLAPDARSKARSWSHFASRGRRRASNGSPSITKAAMAVSTPPTSATLRTVVVSISAPPTNAPAAIP